jgi:biofilm PGA synthesis N-glycosyltransferase PgaC
MWWLTLPVILYSAGLLVLWLIIVRRSKEKEPELVVLPTVSVIVAARNEEKSISELLENIVRQDYPQELLEVIIVNDNSTDRTPIVISEYISVHRGQPGPRMRLIYNPFSGKKRAVRYGIEKADGKVILTTDADCIVGSGWVRSHATWYVDGGPVMVLAPVFQRSSTGFWSYFGVYEFSALQAITEATAVAGHPVMCNAANMSFRREVYLRHADELRSDLPSGDDMFLLQAVMRDGGAVRHDGRSAAVVETAAAVPAAALLRQRARWASKAFHYRDAPTLALAAATAACNAAITAAAVIACFSVAYVPVVGAMYAIRILPDYLLIAREMKKRGDHVQVITFVVSELIYPFYFLVVGVMSLFPSSRRFRVR